MSVTYFDPVNYEQLIPIRRQLYEDLKTTIVVELLDISRPAFKFIDADRLEKCMKWDENISETLTENIEKYREEVINVLSLVLPELGRGLFVQRGDVFGLGDVDPMSPKRVTQYEVKVLNEAPLITWTRKEPLVPLIMNLDSEVQLDLMLRAAILSKVSRMF